MTHRTRHVWVRMVLEGRHATVRMCEERVTSGTWGLWRSQDAMVRITRPWRLVVHLPGVLGELVCDAGRLLCVVHRIDCKRRRGRLLGSVRSAH